MDVLRVDHLTFKEIAAGKLDNLDAIFKKASNDSFNKVRTVEQELNISNSYLQMIIFYSKRGISESD